MAPEKFEKIKNGILLFAKILSFLSIVMSIVIKARILLGIREKDEDILEKNEGVK